MIECCRQGGERISPVTGGASVASRSGNEKASIGEPRNAPDEDTGSFRGAREAARPPEGRSRSDERRRRSYRAERGEMGNRFRVALNLLSMNLEGRVRLPPTRTGLLCGNAACGAGERLAFAGSPRRPYSGSSPASGLMIDLSKVSRQGILSAGRSWTGRGRHLADALLEARSFLFQLNPPGLKEACTPL